MKVLPPSCLQLPSAAVMDRIPLPLPFSPDMLWRYPMSFPPGAQQQQHQFAGSPFQQLNLDMKTQLPSNLSSDPRHWSRDDVLDFLRWCEREFDLPRFDADTFQMNGELERDCYLDACM
jgi:ETS translocation variant 6/7